MEARETKQQQQQQHRKQRSLSDDADSLHDCFHSPLHSDDPDPITSPSKAIVVVDKSISPIPSPKHLNKQKNRSPVVVVNRSVKDDGAPSVTKVSAGDLEGGGGGGGGVGGERQSRSAVTAILRRSKRAVVLKKVELGFRVLEMVLCLISFSVMVADKTEGWSGDSFDRYKEYRYCVVMSVIGFVYGAFQASDWTYHHVNGNHVIPPQFRYHFDFSMDQILAYLLMSASSCAATRVDDWVSNWGKDKFTEMATGSIVMSFLAFAAFAVSSLISGYNLCNKSSGGVN
ncbi:CASP-like protein 4A3 [Impatiens glandulifera]|uniref:CASP-like protein 4A3 n=1 Tax=Impatiens glandulifera TaxID=253017 RepID=UPI001FB19BED|nr:CASP-like protein 4A3 [Impatiens glandulifera]